MNEKLKTADGIAGQINDGWVCFSDIGLAIPPEITDAVAGRASKGELNAITWHSLLDLEPLEILSPGAFGVYPFTATSGLQTQASPDIRQRTGIVPVSWFSGKAFAAAVNTGRADVLPCNYHDMPEHVQGLERIDALLIRTSLLDEEGYFYTGLYGSMMEALTAKSRHIFIEANSNMPRLPGSVKLHISQVDAYCISKRPLPEIHAAREDDISKRIAEYIADEIPDGSTIQLGIGSVPESVGRLLKAKHDLGIHSELFSDSLMELLECGAATNYRKELYAGKSVATVAFGSGKLYRFLDGNPDVLMLPVNVTNDPFVIGRHRNFISVNAALEVDLFGQVCAESIGMKHISGSGGQSDFVRGAALSDGGKSFIAFPSTAAVKLRPNAQLPRSAEQSSDTSEKSSGAPAQSSDTSVYSRGISEQSSDADVHSQYETVSRIRLSLSEGALVTTSKNDVDMIVTEYGIAKLRGKTFSQRARALIAVAHPDFRDELTFAAHKHGLI